MKTFSNERLGIAFSYPAKWEVKTSYTSGFVKISFVPFSRSSVVVIAGIVGPITLDSLVSEFLVDSPLALGVEQENFRKLSITPVKGTTPGKRVKFQVNLSGVDTQLDVTILLRGARYFVLWGEAPVRALALLMPDFEGLLGSLRVTAPTSFVPLPTEGLHGSALLDQIGERTAKLRGLAAKRAVQSRLLSIKELKSAQEKYLLDEETREEISKEKELCVLLDLCSESDDLLKKYTTLLGEGVLGFYDADEKLLSVLRKADVLDPMEWLVVAHEYVHALQDQHFDLTSLQPKGTSFDESMAVDALIEGDALLAESLFYESLPRDQQETAARRLERDAEHFEESPGFTQAPRVIRETFGFPYEAGQAFVARLYLEGGLEAVNQAYLRPPKSTEQVLHPEKYLENEAPKTVDLPEVVTALGGTWREVDRGVLGEFLTSVYLATFVPQQTEAAAIGWGGDRYAILKDIQGRRLIVMRFFWDSQDDAQEFFETYQSFIEAKSQGRWQESSWGDGAILWQEGNTTVLLIRKDMETLVVIGPDQATVTKAATTATPTPTPKPTETPVPTSTPTTSPLPTSR